VRVRLHDVRAAVAYERGRREVRDHCDRCSHSNDECRCRAGPHRVGTPVTPRTGPTLPWQPTY
jgi:hypothetical protein